MNLKRVSKPAGELTVLDGRAIEVKGHAIQGVRDDDDNYYEHDTCCDRWYLLEDEDEDS